MNSTSPVIPVFNFPEDCANVSLTEQEAILASSFNSSFTILFAVLILFMQAGFAALEAGMIQASHARNILLKNTLDMSVGAIAYMLFGYAFSFGDGGSFIGGSKFGLVGFDSGTTVEDCFSSEFSFWFFQFSFAAASSTIVSGAIAERVKFQAYLLVAGIVTGFVYPVVARWLWYSDGWLASMGAIDFAGSGVVHLTGGTIGLVGAVIVGFRNKYANNHEVNPPRFELIRGEWVQNDLPPSSEHLATLGTFLLSLGWIAFNVGSYGAVYSGSPFAGQDLGRIAANTVLSSASCSLVAIVMGIVISSRKAKKNPTLFAGASVDDALNGILSGLVAVTASCAVVTPGIALLIGALNAPILKGASWLMVRLRIDDPLDAFPVHGASGTFGLIAVGLFADPLYTDRIYGSKLVGLFYGDGELLGIQLLTAVVIFAWAAAFSFLMFFAMKKVDESRTDTLFLIKSEESSQHVGFGAGGAAKGDANVLGFALPTAFVSAPATASTGVPLTSLETGSNHGLVIPDANLLGDDGGILGTGTASEDVTKVYAGDLSQSGSSQGKTTSTASHSLPATSKPKSERSGRADRSDRKDRKSSSGSSKKSKKK